MTNILDFPGSRYLKVNKILFTDNLQKYCDKYIWYYIAARTFSNEEVNILFQILSTDYENEEF